MGAFAVLLVTGLWWMRVWNWMRVCEEGGCMQRERFWVGCVGARGPCAEVEGQRVGTDLVGYIEYGGKCHKKGHVGC